MRFVHRGLRHRQGRMKRGEERDNKYAKAKHGSIGKHNDGGLWRPVPAKPLFARCFVRDFSPIASINTFLTTTNNYG